MDNSHERNDSMNTFFRLPLLACAVALAFPVAAQNSFGNSGTPPQQPPQQQQQPRPMPPGSFPDAQQQQQQPQQQQQGMSPEQMTQAERQDMGVRATNQLHSGAMHGPTPNTLPGGQVITTPGLVALVKGGQTQALIFDVLGGPEKLPGALFAVPAHQAGSFDDAVQREFGNFLKGVTQGKQDTPLVFYCQSTQCWMSYNAALRATKMGYKNVLWYRGGIEAWKAAGLPTQPAQQNQPMPQGQPQGQLQGQQQGGMPPR